MSSNTSEVSENKNSKRNPKKASPLQFRSTRRKNIVNYNEEEKDDESFKKPTPQKYPKYSDESDSSPISNTDFKINLDSSNTSLRRSSRNKNQPSYKGTLKANKKRRGRKRLKALNLSSNSINLAEYKLAPVPSIETYMYLGKRIKNIILL